MSTSEQNATTNQDLDHLRLLSIFHYLLAGLTALFGCFPIFHLAFGIAAVTGVLDDMDKSQGSPPPAFIGWVFIAVAVGMMTCMWGSAVAILIAGRKLATRRAYMFCLVIAGIECMFAPIGTALGVFTIIVLVRPSVKQLFQANSSTPDHDSLAKNGK